MILSPLGQKLVVVFSANIGQFLPVLPLPTGQQFQQWLSGFSLGGAPGGPLVGQAPLQTLGARGRRPGHSLQELTARVAGANRLL